MIHVFDIETAPDLDKVNEFTKPFDKDSVKLGNLKDEEKIKAKLEKAEEDYWEGARNKAALNPSTSTICAIGVSDGASNEVMILKGEENVILNEFWELYNYSHAQWAYYTGSNDRSCFDIRHVVHRSWVNSIKVPQAVISSRGYLTEQFVDLAQIYLAGSPNGTYCGANLAAKQLGLIGKDVGFAAVQDKDELEKKYGVNGKDFHKFLASPEHEEIAEIYLKNDLAIERAIADIIL